MHQWRRQGQRGVVDRLTLGAQLRDQLADVDEVPGDDRVVQHAQAAERAELIIEAAPAQGALLAEEQEAREVVRGFALIQLAPLLAAELFVVNGAEDVDRPLYAADLVQGLMHAVLAGIGTKPVDGRINDGDAVLA